MSEWWTYAPEDFLLFSPETYYRLHALQNEALWPAHLGVAALVIALLILGPNGTARAGRIIGLILALVWLFVGWAFHYDRFAAIHLAAPWFAAAFGLQAVLLLIAGPVLGVLRIGPDGGRAQLASYAVFLFAIFIQPLIGLFLGRSLSGLEFFGFAPDPTALATLGLLGAAQRVPWLLMIVPLLWCAVTGITLWAMGAPDWFVTPGLGAAVLVLAVWRVVRRPSALSAD